MAVKIGVFVPNWVGDVAMSTPTLRALRRHFATARIVGVVRPYVGDVLAGTPWLDDQIPYHPKSADRSQRFRGVLGRLRDERLDAIVLLTNSFRSAALAWASGAQRRVGYVRYGRGMLLTDKLYQPRRAGKWLPIPAIDAYLQLAYALGCPWESSRLELATTAADEAAADAVWRRHELLGGRVAVLNSSGAYGAAKLWPSSYFAELARRIAEEHEMSVLVACGPAEREVATEIVKRAAHRRVVSLADKALSIGLTKACIRRSRLLVTTDSGPRFFGVAFGVPVVSLFGPTDVAWTAQPLRGRNVPATRRALRTVWTPHLPAGASRLHAIAIGRAGVRRRARSPGRAPRASGLSAVRQDCGRGRRGRSSRGGPAGASGRGWS